MKKVADAKFDVGDKVDADDGVEVIRIVEIGFNLNKRKYAIDFGNGNYNPDIFFFEHELRKMEE